jgi:hypothetical protein
MLFSSSPGDGHLLPLLPLARAMRRRGHEIAFATSDGHRQQLSAESFPLFAMGITAAELLARLGPFLPQIMAAPIEHRRSVAFPRIFAVDYAPTKIDDLLAVCASWEPDVLVYECADLAAPLVAAALDLTSVNHSFGVPIPLPVLERAAEAMAPHWTAHGLRPEDYAGSFRGLYVDICPPSFGGADVPTTRVRQSPCAVTRVEPPGWLAGLGRPSIYVTLGTVHNTTSLFRPLLDGIQASGAAVSTLVTIGRGGDPRALDPLPPQTRVEPYVPQEQILPSCDLVISHGGSGTMLGSLAYGVPMLLVPQGADQFDNARQCAAAGAAITLTPGQVSVESVREAITRLLAEPAFRASAERLAAEIAAMPSPDEAAAELDGLWT